MVTAATAAASVAVTITMFMCVSSSMAAAADAFHYKSLVLQRQQQQQQRCSIKKYNTDRIDYRGSRSGGAATGHWHVCPVSGTTFSSPLVVFYHQDDKRRTASSASTSTAAAAAALKASSTASSISTTPSTKDHTTTTTIKGTNNLLHAGDIKWISTPHGGRYHSAATTYAAATTTATRSGVAGVISQQHPRPRMRDHFSQLVAMTRPKNLPGVVLFHMLGTWLTFQSVMSLIEKNAATAASSFVTVPAVSYQQLLLQPPMVITLLALVLTSSTSMLVNDYYDYKLGNDEGKDHKHKNILLSSSSSSSSSPSSSSGLVVVDDDPKGYLPPILVKRFTSYLYATALFCTTCVPGTAARSAVIGGLMLTFWYTQHLKPRTWLKNFVCGGLIAASPLTSSMAAMSWLAQRYDLTTSFRSQMTLVRLFATVFIGIVGREMTMDINDVNDDAKHNVRTVPVVYGRRFASRIGVVCSLCVLSLGIIGPLYDMIITGTVGSITGSSSRRRLIVNIRRLTMATIGGLAQLRRSWQVFQTEGNDADVVDVAVDEGLLTVILLMASFV